VPRGLRPACLHARATGGRLGPVVGASAGQDDEGTSRGKGGGVAPAKVGFKANMSRVDVVIPCYNYGRYLRGCVESVLAQPGTDLRVLIVDDASQDHTPEVAAELVARDRRVGYRRHATNQGHIATYNESLLGWADGDYSLPLSGDDLCLPRALARAHET